MPVEYRRALAELEGAAKPAEAAKRRSSPRAVTHRWVRSPASSRFEREDRRLRSRSRSAFATAREFVAAAAARRRSREQAARCMDCGIPYCHTGCPVNNQIPDWNDLVYRGDWEEARAQPALDQQFPGSHRPRLPGAVRGVLHAQHRRQSGHHQDDRMRDRRPRLRGRLDRARAAARARPARGSRWSARARPGWPARSSSRAPATTCIVFEKNAKAGGLLRYGIPDFKMEKHIVDRRVDADGGRGRHLPLRRPCRRRPAGRDARSRTTTRWCWPAAPRRPRDLPIPGRELDGIHFAMDFLPQQNRRDQRRGAPATPSRSSPAASTSSSSAAATPAPTASAPRSARAPRRSPSSRSCRSRRSTRTSR